MYKWKVFSQILWRLLRFTTGICVGAVIIQCVFIYIYINCLDFNIDKGRFCFYANSNIVYCSAPSKQQSVASLQSAFDIIQNRFCALKLVLNVFLKNFQIQNFFRKLYCSSDFSGEPYYLSVREQILGCFYQ